MSTGKRLAKRSILGTRVCAPKDDGVYYPGVIQATKQVAEDVDSTYSVLFEDKNTQEYRGFEIVGPGFLSVSNVKLGPGQKVYVTYNGREIAANVLSHLKDEVLISINVPSCAQNELRKRIEEVRLMESRKSARLQDVDTNYSKLADGLPEARRRTSSFSIEVPGSVSGRKRRPSTDDGVMDDCMAAMVLMHLSCSPKSPRLPLEVSCSGTPDAWSSASSWTSNDARNGTPSPPQSHDEGIDLEDYLEESHFPSSKRKQSPKSVFQCLWPGCGNQYDTSSVVEKHIRTQHLGRTVDLTDSDSSDREEDFYYTEIEVDAKEHLAPSIYASSAPTLSHLDMVRPPHEDPEYNMVVKKSSNSSSSAINIPFNSWSSHVYATSAPNYMGSPQKCMKLSPKPATTFSPKISSPLHKRGRSESRKCRKVYGMENRDLWCTQCKWKKACSRFAD